MRIARLSKDLFDIVRHLDIKEAIPCGHSIGCSVLWSYLELFGESGIKAAILIDQSPVIMSTCYIKDNYKWYLLDIQDFSRTICQMATKEGYQSMLMEHFRDGFVSDSSLKAGDLTQWMNEAMKMNPRNIARLMMDTLIQDWTDMVCSIRIPCLILSGESSMVPWQTQQWLHTKIPNAKLKILSTKEGGVHAMFLDEIGLEKIWCHIEKHLKEL